MDRNRYGVLAVTVMAVFVAAVAAVITRDSWADKPNQKASGVSTDQLPTTTAPTVPFVSAPPSFLLPTTTAVPSKKTTTTTIHEPSPVVSTPASRSTSTTVGAPGGATTTTTATPSSGDQRSDSSATFRYGPNPQDRDAGSQPTRSSTAPIGLSVGGYADPSDANTWHLAAEVANNTTHDAHFASGIDVVEHLICNGVPADEHLHDPAVVTIPAGGGVVLHLDLGRIDAGPGTCTITGSVHYSF